MSIATSQQLTKYYDTFRAIAVTYTKEVVKSSGLQPQNVFVKCLGEQWPCVLYSSSFNEAKVLAPNRPGLMERIAKANNLVSVRLSLQDTRTSPIPLLFFISGRVSGFSPYAQSNGTLQFIVIQFTQRPPDDFVEIMGRLLEANVASTRRRDDEDTPDARRHADDRARAQGIDDHDRWRTEEVHTAGPVVHRGEGDNRRSGEVPGRQGLQAAHRSRGAT